MKNLKDIIGLSSAECISIAGVVIQPDMMLKWISFGVTILCSIVTLIYTITKLIKVGKSGKLSIDDVNLASREVMNELENIKQEINGMKGEENDKFI